MENMSQHKQCAREVDWQIRSNRPLLYICTHEEERVLTALSNICERRKSGDKWTMYTWDIANRLECNNPQAPMPTNGEDTDQLSVLTWFDAIGTGLGLPDEGYTLLVLKDFHKFLEKGEISDQIEKQVVRQLRNMCQKYKYQHKCVVLLGIDLHLSPELMKLSTIIDWPLPEKEHIAEQITKMIDSVKKRSDLSHFEVNYSDDEMEEIISSLQGLTLNEIELLNSYIVLTHDRLSPMLE
jgi:hypothetical protein